MPETKPDKEAGVRANWPGPARAATGLSKLGACGPTGSGKTFMPLLLAGGHEVLARSAMDAHDDEAQEQPKKNGGSS